MRTTASSLLAITLSGALWLADATQPAAARMYQWVNPATGSTQFSGEPPSWYRARSDGPRVLVFEKGFLVDDTAIEVSVVRRLALRQRAFEELERRRTLEALARVQEAEEKKARLAARRASEPEPEPTLAEKVTSAARVAAEELPDVLDPAAIERLKSIISAFDKRGG